MGFDEKLVLVNAFLLLGWAVLSGVLQVQALGLLYFMKKPYCIFYSKYRYVELKAQTGRPIELKVQAFVETLSQMSLTHKITDVPNSKNTCKM